MGTELTGERRIWSFNDNNFHVIYEIKHRFCNMAGNMIIVSNMLITSFILGNNNILGSWRIRIILLNVPMIKFVRRNVQYNREVTTSGRKNNVFCKLFWKMKYNLIKSA